MKLTLKLGNSITQFNVPEPCVITKEDDEVTISEVPRTLMGQPDIDVVCEGVPVRNYDAFFKASLEKIAPTSSIAARTLELLATEKAFDPVTYATAELLQKKVCDKPIVKQVRSILGEKISDDLFNAISKGIRQLIVDASAYEFRTGVCPSFILKDLDIIFCTTMFVAAGYKYTDVVRTVKEHSNELGVHYGAVISKDWFDDIKRGKRHFGLQPLSRVIGIIK